MHVFVGIEGCAPFAIEAHHHLVLAEVGRFDIHLHTIAQRQFLRPEAIVALTHDSARLRQLGNQFFGYLFLPVSLITARLSGFHPLFHLLSRRFCEALFVREIADKHLVAVGNQLRDSLVHLVERHLTVKPACHLQLFLSRQHRFGSEKMIDRLAYEMAVLTVVALGVLPFHRLHAQRFRTLQLRSGKTMLARLFSHTDDGIERTTDILLAATEIQRERLLRARNEECSRAHRSTQYGRHRLMLQLLQTVTQHGGNETVHIFATLR